jgi:hypothetical protein
LLYFLAVWFILWLFFIFFSVLVCCTEKNPATLLCSQLHTCFLRQLLLCRVALGKSFLQFNAMKMAHAPPGHHSVVGRPSVGGLSFPEYVVYRGEQVTPSFFSDFSNADCMLSDCMLSDCMLSDCK